MNRRKFLRYVGISSVVSFLMTKISWGKPSSNVLVFSENSDGSFEKLAPNSNEVRKVLMDWDSYPERAVVTFPSGATVHGIQMVGGRKLMVYVSGPQSGQKAAPLT